MPVAETGGGKGRGMSVRLNSRNYKSSKWLFAAAGFERQLEGIDYLVIIIRTRIGVFLADVL
jgi:hypothetical protein